MGCLRLPLIAILAGLHLSLPCAAQERLLVIGDSLSSGRSSWPMYLEGAHIMAQPGRMIAHYDPPRDLHGFPGEVVVYMLGCNDIGYDSAHGGDPKPVLWKLREHLEFLVRRGFKVLFVIPPDLGLPHLAVSSQRHRKAFKALKVEGVVAVDLNRVWDSNRTVDGVHPDDSLSYDIAVFIRSELSHLD